MLDEISTIHSQILDDNFQTKSIIEKLDEEMITTRGLKSSFLLLKGRTKDTNHQLQAFLMTNLEIK